MSDFDESKVCQQCLRKYGFCLESRHYENSYKEDGSKHKKEDYISSATNGDYSPSNPWDAPGMSIKDFI